MSVSKSDIREELGKERRTSNDSEELEASDGTPSFTVYEERDSESYIVPKFDELGGRDAEFALMEGPSYINPLVQRNGTYQGPRSVELEEGEYYRVQAQREEGERAVISEYYKFEDGEFVKVDREEAEENSK